MKKFMSLLLAIVLFVCTMQDSVSATSKNGFTYDTSVDNVEWKKVQSFNVCAPSGNKIGTCSYVIGVAREKKTNNYVLMTREVMTPEKSRTKIRHVMNRDISYDQYGYGFSEFVSANVTLPSLDDYQPQNAPISDSIEFSIGADSSGVSVGASYTVEHSDLDITACCNTPSKLFFVKYNYKPSLVNPFASNKYVANESVQLGMAAFHTGKKTVSFTMNYDARFGWASNKSISPMSIARSDVFKAKKSKTYSFTLAKK